MFLSHFSVLSYIIYDPLCLVVCTSSTTLNIEFIVYPSICYAKVHSDSTQSFDSCLRKSILLIVPIICHPRPLTTSPNFAFRSAFHIRIPYSLRPPTSHPDSIYLTLHTTPYIPNFVLSPDKMCQRIGYTIDIIRGVILDIMSTKDVLSRTSLNIL